MSVARRLQARTRVFAVAAALCIAAACAGAYHYHRAHGLPARFAVVQPAVLYRSAQPSVGQLERAVRDHGIRTVLIVREASERVAAEAAWARAAHVRVVHVPIASRQAIPATQLAEFWQTVDDPGNHPILVHCSAGRHRTGVLCALYRVLRQGWTPQRARAEMLSFGFESEGHRPLLEQFDAAVRGDEGRETARAAARAAGRRVDPE